MYLCGQQNGQSSEEGHANNNNFVPVAYVLLLTFNELHKCSQQLMDTFEEE